MKKALWIIILAAMMTVFCAVGLAHADELHAWPDGQSEDYDYLELWVQYRDSAVLKVNVSADSMEGITYQWVRDVYEPEDDMWHWYDIEGEVSDTFTVEDITSRSCYICRVQDADGNECDVYFNIYIRNELDVYVDSESGGIPGWGAFVNPGAAVLMKVGATAINDEGLTYRWYQDGELIEGADGPELTAVTYSHTIYRCEVTDLYDNTEYADFLVFIRPDAASLQTLALNEQARVTVTDHIAFCRFTPAETAEYSLYSIIDKDTYGYLLNEDMQILDQNDDGGEGTNFKLHDVLEAGRTYIFAIRFYSVEKTGDIDLYLDTYYENNLRASAENGPEFFVNPGGTVSMKVNVTANDMTGLEYRWYKDNEQIEGANGLELTVTANETAFYMFQVKDQYKNEKEIDFRVFFRPDPAAMQVLVPGEQTDVMVEDGIAYCRFTPEETAKYSFYSLIYQDTYGYLLDGNMQVLDRDDDDGEQNNFRIDRVLEAGEEYIYGIRFYEMDKTGTIRVCLKRLGVPAESLAGGGDRTVRVGETICFRKSEFHPEPEGSLLDGAVSYADAAFHMYGSNYLFSGNSTYHEEHTNNGDVLVYITPNTPGYYPVYGYVEYYDETTGGNSRLSSDYFILTVLDENGNEPEPIPVKAEIFPIPSVTVGETVQINWSISGYRPYTSIIKIMQNGVVLDAWNYNETDRDTCVFDTAGVYTIRVEVTDMLQRTAIGDYEVTVTEAKPLELKGLTLQMRTSITTGAIIAGGIRWDLDYEGGIGTKTSEIHLINVETGEDILLYSERFYPSFTESVNPGTYYLHMNVEDDEGDHWIDSNRLTVEPVPEWDFIMPAGLTGIEDNGFEGIKAGNVKINNGCTSIGKSAFANASVRNIYIPMSVTSIGNNAIPSGATIYTLPGSWAESWAAGNYQVVLGR